jgi:ClpA/ClpB-like protein
MTPPAPNLQELIETIRRDADSDDPLDQLATASSTVTELNETSDAALGYFVDRARASGKSWVEISKVLGVTKQAVHKRFSSPWPKPTFERFTQKARTIMTEAPTFARSLNHAYIGTEHLLLAQLAEPDSIAGKILLGAGVTEAKLREAIPAGGPDKAPEPDAELPYTPRASEALGLALSEALKLGHNYIGTEHILLALYRNPEGLAAKALNRFGLDVETANAKVVEALAGYSKS